VSPKVDYLPKGMKNLLANEPPLLVVKVLQRCASSSRNVCSETPGRFAILSAIPVVINLAPSYLQTYLMFLGNNAYNVSSCSLPIMSLRRDFISSRYPNAGCDFQHHPIVTPSLTPNWALLMWTLSLLRYWRKVDDGCFNCEIENLVCILILPATLFTETL
jgi:hypothetical protein